MIITVVAMHMVQPTVDQVVEMVAMGHDGMAAAMMAATGTSDRLAHDGIGRADFNHVLIVMIGVRVMQVTIVQIVDVVAVLDLQVATVGMMLVAVILVGFALHLLSLLQVSVQ